MKAIQVMMDERLLKELDDTNEVRQAGRSAVLRRALEDWLQRRRKATIADAYRRAYGTDGDLDTEWAAWEDQGVWPVE
jgi:metal-responsive CopG/Arc/MetJ family transcriptional regulator